MTERTMGVPAQQNYIELLRQNERQRETIEQLGQLCRDMFTDFGSVASCIQNYTLASIMDDFKQRMEQLGLLEEQCE